MGQDFVSPEPTDVGVVGVRGFDYPVQDPKNAEHTECVFQARRTPTRFDGPQGVPGDPCPSSDGVNGESLELAPRCRVLAEDPQPPAESGRLRSDFTMVIFALKFYSDDYISR